MSLMMTGASAVAGHFGMDVVEAPRAPRTCEIAAAAIESHVLPFVARAVVEDASDVAAAALAAAGARERGFSGGAVDAALR